MRAVQTTSDGDALSRSRSGGWWRRLLRAALVPVAALGMLAGVLVPVAPAAAAGPAVVSVGPLRITDTNGNTLTTINTAVNLSYRVEVPYSCSTADCTGVQIQLAPVALDPYYNTYRRESAGISYIPPYVGAPNPTGNAHTGVTLTLPSVTAGTGGTFTIGYSFSYNSTSPAGGSFFPNGSLVQPSATIMAANSDAPGTATTSATWVSTIRDPTLTFAGGAATQTDDDYTVSLYPYSDSGCMRYTYVYGNARSHPLYTCAQSYQTVIQLPAKAVYVGGSGGTYDPVAHTVTLANSGTAAAGGVVLNTSTFRVQFPSSEYPTTGAGCSVNETFTASQTVTYLEGSVRTVTAAPKAVTIGNCEPFGKASVGKSSYTTATGGPPAGTTIFTIPTTPGEISTAYYWQATGYNMGNVPGQVTLVDNTLDQPDLPVRGFQVLGSTGSVTYTLDDGTVTTVNVPVNGTIPAPAGRRIVAATATSGLLAGPNTTPAGTAGTPFTLRFFVNLAYGATPGTRTNTATATVTYPDYPQLGTVDGGSSSRTVTLNAPTNVTLSASAPGATVTGGGTALVGSEVIWAQNGAIQNLPSGSTLVPQYVFLAPVGWNIAANGASFATPVSGATFTYRTVTYNGNTHQAVVVNWPAPTGQIGTVSLPQLRVTTTPTGAAPAGTSNQTASFFVGDVANSIVPTYSPAKYVDITDLDADASAADAFAVRSGVTSLAPTLALGVTKEICQPNPNAADGCTWIANSNITVGVSPNASSIKYRVTITNTGNAALNNVVAYDVLPYLGDVGTSDATAGTPRGSTVQEVVASVSDVGAGVVLDYSTSTSPPRPNVYSGATSGTWAASPTVGASAIRATIASLPAFASRSFVYEASLVGGSADKIACNSIAVIATSLATLEPAPVCATTQEADFSIETADRFPLQEGRVGTIPFVVTNGGGSATASGTVVLDVPTGLSIVDLVIPGWNCTAPGMTGPVELTCLPVNGNGTVRSLAMDVPETIALRVLPATGTADSELCVAGEVSGLMFDPDLANNATDGCSFSTSGESLLNVVKSDGVVVAAPGDTLTYTINAANGLVAEAVTGAVVSDTLPANVTFVSASDGGTLSGADVDGRGGTVTWPAINLAAAGTPDETGETTSGAPGSFVTRTVTVSVPADASGAVVNTAYLTAADPANPALPLQAEGSDTDGLGRLTVTKSNDAAAAGVRAGDVVEYTVTLENDGTVDYTAGNAAYLLDDLGAVLDDAVFEAGSAEISVDGGTAQSIDDPDADDLLQWSGALAVGETAVLTYRVTVGDGSAGDRTLTNTAFASDEVSTCTDGVDANAESCDTVTTPFAPVLAKTIQSLTQNDDGTWTTVYAVTVTNLSPVSAATYSLSDALAYGAGIQVLSAAVTSAPAGVTTAAWSGTGAIATAVALPAAGQHVYQITVTADAHQVAGTAAAQCAAGVSSGFANRATLSLTDGRTVLAEACASPAAPTVDKTVAAPVQLPDGHWSIVYTVTVSNPNPSPTNLAYTLEDALSIPGGITVDSILVAGPAGAPVNPAFDGTGDTSLLTGVDRIPAGSSGSPATRIFTITVVVDAASGAGTPGQLACPPAGSGGYANAVTLLAGTGTTVLGTDTACADATPQPMPTVTKQVVGSSIDVNGIWTVVYQIDVANADPQYSTRYTLDDELQFAAGTAIVSAAVSSGDVVPSPTWNGASDQRIVTDEPLPAATTHTFSVIVEADPGSLDPESALADCRLDAGETGTGYRNVATVTSGVAAAFAAACEPFTDPSVVKTTVGVPTQDPVTGIWTLGYQVTVTNRSTSTMGTIPYTLTDTLDLPAGAEVVGEVETTAPAGGTVNPDFDGTTDTDLGSGAIGAAADETTPATQVFTVTVHFTVQAGISSGAQCDPAQGPGGLRNEVEVVVGQRISGAVACADLPDVPAPGLTKTVLSHEQQADGTWLLLYRVTVANPSGTVTSSYSLEDEFALGAGIVLDSPPTIVAQPIGVTIDPAWDGVDDTTLVENILLPGGGSHTYTVRAVIDSGSVRGSDPAGDCTLDTGETGTGFLNTASLDTGAAEVDTQACATAWDPAVTKEINGVPTQQPDGSWLLSYTMTVTNPSASVDLMYGLVDELDFPTGTVTTIESAAGRPGSPTVESDWDGETQTQLVADGTPLPANAIHVFDVTVRAVLPADQTSEAGGFGNLARVESGVGNVITTEAEALADIEVPELVVGKAVTADPILRIGDQVEYEITIENTGLGDYTALFPAVVWDDLTDVLDDASLNAAPVADPATGSVTVANDLVRWAQPLAAGDVATLTYTVTVTGGGDANLVNIAFQTLPTAVSPAAPPPAECDVTCDLTETAMPALDIDKTASDSSIARGETVEYTVEITNTGGVDLPDSDPARFTDDLSDVLDNAAYNGDAAASSGTVTVSGATLSWEGALAAGETVTVTYSVDVDADAAFGATLRNVAVSDPTLATLALGDDEDPGVASTSTAIVALGATGAAAPWAAVIVAMMLLAAGFIVRRRRHDEGVA